MANELNELPTSLEALGTFGSNNVPVNVTGVWFKFFLSVSKVLGNFVDGVIGYSVDNAVTASGASQSTATPLDTEIAVITSGAVNTGVVVNAFGPGTVTQVFNRSGSSKNVYPPSGTQIDSLGLNAPYPLANNKMQVFSQISNVQYQSMQLG